MSLIPWKSKKLEGGDERSPMGSLRHEVDRLVESFMREPFGALDWALRRGREAWPAVDISQTDREIVIQAELPGVEPGDVDVTLTGDQLVLAGEKKESSEKKDRGAYVSECCYGAFRRSFTLPEPVDPDNVSAEYAQGVLTVKLQKLKPASVKRIEVKTQS